MDERRWAYIGRRSDGMVVSAVADDPQLAGYARWHVSTWMKNGLTIERVPAEWVRKFLFTSEPYPLPDPSK